MNIALMIKKDISCTLDGDIDKKRIGKPMKDLGEKTLSSQLITEVEPMVLISSEKYLMTQINHLPLVEWLKNIDSEFIVFKSDGEENYINADSFLAYARKALGDVIELLSIVSSGRSNNSITRSIESIFGINNLTTSNIKYSPIEIDTFSLKTDLRTLKRLLENEIDRATNIERTKIRYNLEFYRVTELQLIKY